MKKLNRSLLYVLLSGFSLLFFSSAQAYSCLDVYKTVLPTTDYSGRYLVTSATDTLKMNNTSVKVNGVPGSWRIGNLTKGAPGQAVDTSTINITKTTGYQTLIITCAAKTIPKGYESSSYRYNFSIVSSNIYTSTRTNCTVSGTNFCQ
jgi:hypothetical protein